MSFLVIAHSKRSESVPHWQHASTIELMKKPCRFCHIYENHIFDIGKSRQGLAEVAVSKIPEMTHILYVDDDIVVPDPQSLLYMFDLLEKQNASIVSGLYYRSTPPHYPLIMSLVEHEDHLTFGFPYTETPPENLLAKVGAVPAGFLLIKREALEKIPRPWFVYGDPELSKKQPTDQLPGEDIYFSLKARKAGFELWVDCRADLLHYVPQFVGNKKQIAKILRTSDEKDVMIGEMRQQLKKSQAS